MVVVSVMLLLDSSKYLANEGEDSQMYYSIIYILLGAGSFMAIVGFLGCCGALRENPSMLCTVSMETSGYIVVCNELATLHVTLKGILKCLFVQLVFDGVLFVGL